MAGIPMTLIGTPAARATTIESRVFSMQWTWPLVIAAFLAVMSSMIRTSMSIPLAMFFSWMMYQGA